MSEHRLAPDGSDPLVDYLPSDLPPEALKQHLADLIRHYVHGGRSESLANRVVRHCQALYLHPALCDQPEERDAFRDLAQHWRRLAAQFVLGASHRAPVSRQPGAVASARSGSKIGRVGRSSY